MLVRVGERWFGIPTQAIREVALKGAVTRVPSAPRQVLGIANLRGSPVPVVSLEQLVGAPGQARDTTAVLPRLVVVQASEYEVALVVDEIRGIVEPVAPLILRDESGERPAFMREALVWQGETILLLDIPALVIAAAGLAEGSA